MNVALILCGQARYKKMNFCKSPEEAEDSSELKMFFHHCHIPHSYRKFLYVDQFSTEGLKDLKILYKVISLGKIDEEKTFQPYSCPTEGQALSLSAVGINMPMYADSNTRLQQPWDRSEGCVFHILHLLQAWQNPVIFPTSLPSTDTRYSVMWVKTYGRRQCVPSATGSCSTKLLVSGSLAYSFPCVLQEHPEKLTRYLG